MMHQLNRWVLGNPTQKWAMSQNNTISAKETVRSGRDYLKWSKRVRLHEQNPPIWRWLSAERREGEGNIFGREEEELEVGPGDRGGDHMLLLEEMHDGRQSSRWYHTNPTTVMFGGTRKDDIRLNFFKELIFGWIFPQRLALSF